MTLGVLQMFAALLVAVPAGMASLYLYRKTKSERGLSMKIFSVLSSVMLIANAAALMAADGRYQSDIASGLLFVLVYTGIMIPIWSAIGIALVTATATLSNMIHPDHSIFPDTWYKVCIGAALGLIFAPLLLYIVAHLSKILD